MSSEFKLNSSPGQCVEKIASDLLVGFKFNLSLIRGEGRGLLIVLHYM